MINSRDRLYLGVLYCCFSLSVLRFKVKKSACVAVDVIDVTGRELSLAPPGRMQRAITLLLVNVVDLRVVLLRLVCALLAGAFVRCRRRQVQSFRLLRTGRGSSQRRIVHVEESRLFERRLVSSRSRCVRAVSSSNGLVRSWLRKIKRGHVLKGRHVARNIRVDGRGRLLMMILMVLLVL